MGRIKYCGVHKVMYLEQCSICSLNAEIAKEVVNA